MRKRNKKRHMSENTTAPAQAVEPAAQGSSAPATAPRKKKRSGLGCILHMLYTLLVSAVVFLALVTLAGIAALLVYWNWFLPDHITERFLPPVQKKYALDSATFKIRRLGLTGLDLAEFEITDDAGGKLRVDSIRSDFGAELLDDRRTLQLAVKNVTLSGADIGIQVRQGQFHIDGLDLDRIRQAAEQAAEEGAPDSAPAQLPMDVKFRFLLEKITLHAVQLRFDWEGKRLSIPVDAILTPGDPEWSLIHADLTLTPRGQQIHLKLDFNRSTGKLTAKLDSTIRLETLADLTGFEPAGTLKLELACDAETAGEELRLSGTLRTGLAFSPQSQLPVHFERDLDLSQKFSLSYRLADGTFRALFSGTAQLPPLSIQEELVKLRDIDPAQWRLVLSGSSKSLKIEDAELTTGGIRLEAYGGRFDAPLLRLYKANGRFLIAGSGMTFNDPERAIAVSDIALTIPLPPDGEMPGSFRAGSIRFGERELGKIDSSFQLQGRDVKLRGNAETPFAPGAGIDFRGFVHPKSGAAPDLLFEVNLPTYTPPAPLKLEDYVPGIGRATGNASVALGGALRYEEGQLTTGVHLFLSNGTFAMPENDLSLEGVSLDLRFNDLLAATTPPSQKLTVKKISAGKINISDLQINFEVKSPTLTVIESARFDWCGGELYMRSLPIRTNQQVWETVFYCENLNFAQLLTETGMTSSKIDGDGVLFGKLPVRVSRRNGISFDTGYLYTRPGKEGTLKIANPEQLVTGSGAVMRQAQIEFASEALRDFRYNWIKLDLRSEKGELIVALQLDGRPAGPLPFTTDEETGQLRRDPNGRANFQGIQLNINTRLPLNRFLKINEKLQTILKE